MWVSNFLQSFSVVSGFDVMFKYYSAMLIECSKVETLEAFLRELCSKSRVVRFFKNEEVIFQSSKNLLRRSIKKIERIDRSLFWAYG